MRTLVLVPDKSISLRPAAKARGVTLPSPTIEIGAIEPEQPVTVQAAWNSLGAIEFTYLMAFWRTGALQGAQAFKIELPIGGSDPVECAAKFVGSMTVENVGGATASCSASVIAIPSSPRFPLSSAAEALVALITEDL